MVIGIDGNKNKTEVIIKVVNKKKDKLITIIVKLRQKSILLCRVLHTIRVINWYLGFNYRFSLTIVSQVLLYASISISMTKEHPFLNNETIFNVLIKPVKLDSGAVQTL